MDPRPLGRQFVAELVLVDVAVDSLMDELPRGLNSSAPNLVDVVGVSLQSPLNRTTAVSKLPN